MGSFFNNNSMQPFERFNSFFDNVMEPFGSFGRMFGNSFKIDVKEDDKEYTVEAELAGFNKEDIKINFENGLLTISAEKNESKEKEEKNYVYRERSGSMMSRTINLKDADGDNIKAKFNNGELVVMLPKTNNGKSKNIVIE